MEYLTPNESFTTCFKTRNDVYHYKFIWNIVNFSSYDESTSIKSPSFEVIPNQDWQIVLVKENQAIFMFLLRHETDNYSDINVDSVTAFLDENEKLIHIHCRKFTCHHATDYHSLLSKFDKLEKINSLLNDILYINCQLKIDLQASNTVKDISCQFKNKFLAFEAVCDDLKKIHDSSSQTDIILKVRGVPIKAHKNIVCARSPVLAKMFDHNFQENKDSMINIEDIDAETMMKFIALLYYPVLDDDINIDSACSLYYAADKYEVLSVRDVIAKFMLSNLKEENCLCLLEFSNLYEGSFLQSEIQSFFNVHIENICIGDDWEQFAINNAKLASSLISKYFSIRKYSSITI